jgi:hypothetical protein
MKARRLGDGGKELEIKARQETIESVQKEKACAVSFPSNVHLLPQYPSSACFYLCTKCFQCNCIVLIFVAKIE